MKRPLDPDTIAVLRAQVREHGPVPVCARAHCGTSTLYRALRGTPLADVTRAALTEALSPTSQTR